MKTVKLIGFLLLSILLQILLTPFRLLKFCFTILIKIFKILESTLEHLILEIKKEVLKK